MTILEFSREGRSLEKYLQRRPGNFSEAPLECVTRGEEGPRDPVIRNPDLLVGALTLDSGYLNEVL